MLAEKESKQRQQFIEVKKRDGRTQSFDQEKIVDALFQAGQHAEDNYSLEKIRQLVADIQERIDLTKNINLKPLKTSTIDQVVLDVLEQNEHFSLATAYKKRREEKKQGRENRRDINIMIQNLLQADKEIVNENANKDSNVFNTQRDLTAGTVGKAIGLKLLPSHVANAHEKGEIHYHDLDYTPYAPMSNCCLIDFEAMFKGGFQIGNAEVESPRSIQTAAAQTAQIIANVASSQYGGCSFDRIDEILAPYAEINYEKHLNIAKEWIPTKKSKKHLPMSGRKKIFMMPCKV